ncbi:cation-translocating P-type ATPase [Ilumatobacter nonamiensis]|uniref:cation-translocating P-type ATPase n=1 Tax=Ilumatobacter nonamiensis TaxID=467093 RepID=UPI000A02213B|nr:cation-translocating P-type ATPase [Ilumatobacter nonamiensis]
MTAVADNDVATVIEPVEWHRLPVSDVLDHLGASVDGLSANVAAERLAEHGPNELVDTGSSSPWRLVWAQISAVMVLILIGAALLSLILGKYLEAGAIGAIVVLFTLLGFFQEYRAEKAIAALRKMAVPVIRVVRDGRTTEVAAGELVPGDIVQLDAGSIVPADVRLIEAANLRVEEAALTGESEPADKQTEAIDEESLPLGDRMCVAYSGTQVTAGRGVGVVIATGMSTELGRIATLLQGVDDEDTPLQARLDKVGKQLAFVGIGVAGLVVLMGALGGEGASELVLTAISVAVAVIPEGLPAVVTFTLAIGSQRMLRRNALIRKLPAVETLGSVTVICSDKTGTLTQNQMTVTMLDVADHDIVIDPDGTPDASDFPATARAMVGAVVLCNDAQAEADDDGAVTLLGDPTETALLQLAANVGVDVGELRARFSRVAENPFDSGRKRMSTVHAPLDDQEQLLFAELPQGCPIAFVKGAIDGLIERASGVWSADGPVDIDDTWRRRVLDANERLAADGRRVLGVAYRTFDDDSVSGEHEGLAGQAEDDLVILGLIGMIDPPRTEVRDAVAVCRRAGIRPVMITGDHPLTAKAIATELGIAGDDRVLTGVDLDRLTEAEFADAAAAVSVFARVSPEHKLRIVSALQEQHQVVAMTGDGVNDAPALKRADIGVAMGITGTDVSKEASDMVLRDDNFATIVAAVEEGRVIYDNLRRFVSFAVAGNLGKIIVMLGWPIPFLVSGSGSVESAVALLPLQLLWLNLMTDGLLGLSMGVEPAERGVMQRAPHRPGASLWADGLGRRTIWIGALIGVVSLGVGFAYELDDRIEWQTMIFTTLAFMQVAQAIGTRSNTESLRSIGFFTNPLLLAIAGVVTSLQLVAIYTPLRGFLDLEPLGIGDLAVCAATGVLLLVVLEVVKARARTAARTTTTEIDANPTVAAIPVDLP